VCPMGCPKELRNGPCGGVGADGSCEVYPDRRCVWVDAYDRAAAAQKTGDLRLLHRPIDHRRWGQSSWLNYWQGRDEQLWTDANNGARP
jgi:Methylene-tetrahydrofolate reductase C terminal